MGNNRCIMYVICMNIVCIDKPDTVTNNFLGRPYESAPSRKEGLPKTGNYNSMPEPVFRILLVSSQLQNVTKLVSLKLQLR